MEILFSLTVLIIYLCLILLLYLLSRVNHTQAELAKIVKELIQHTNEVSGRLGWAEITILEILRRLDRLETKDTQE